MKMLKIAAVISTSLLFIGCQSTTEEKTEEIVETNKQINYLSEAKASLDALQLDIEKSKEDNLSYFSPDIYEKAVEAYQEAFSHYAETIADGHSSMSFKSKTEQYEESKLIILAYISQSKQQLNAAYSMKSSTETILAETFAQKQRLDELNVATLYARDYKRILTDIDELVELIAEGDVVDAQEDQPELLTKMAAIEVRAVKQIELGNIDQQIAQIKKTRQNKYIPISYKNLLVARDKASSTISVDPRDTQTIKTAVDLAKYELAHVYQLSKEVTRLRNTDSKNYESYVLGHENHLATIANALGLAGIKNLTFSGQVDALSNQGEVLQQNLSMNATDLANLQGHSAKTATDLEQQKEQLSAQLQILKSENKTLNESHAALQVAFNQREIELIKLKAYKEALDSINQAKQAPQVLQQPKVNPDETVKTAPLTKALNNETQAPTVTSTQATETIEAVEASTEASTVTIEQPEAVSVERVIAEEVVNETPAAAIVPVIETVEPSVTAGQSTKVEATEIITETVPETSTDK